MKIVIAFLLLVLLTFVFSGEESLYLDNQQQSGNNSLPSNINSALVGVWKLSEANVEGLADYIEFLNNGIAYIYTPNVYREELTWSIDEDNNLVTSQGGGLFTAVYTITELTESTLSYEGTASWFGFVRVTFKRESLPDTGNSLDTGHSSTEMHSPNARPSPDEVYSPDEVHSPDVWYERDFPTEEEYTMWIP